MFRVYLDTDRFKTIARRVESDAYDNGVCVDLVLSAFLFRDGCVKDGPFLGFYVTADDLQRCCDCFVDYDVMAI